MRNSRLKKYVLLMILIFSASHLSIAQKNYGFYGKKNFLEVTSVSYVPVVNNLFNSTVGYDTGYEKVGNSLVTASTDWFNTGFRVSLGRAFQKNFAASFEYGIGFWSAPVEPRFYANENPDIWIWISKLENLKMNTAYFMPKIHFASKSALLPLGLNHEVGIGFTRSVVKKKEYLYVLENVNGDDPGSSSEFIDFDRSYRGIQILYCLKMRKPLSKSLLLSYGIRYTFDFAMASSSSHSYSTKYYSMTNEQIEQATKSNNFKNILSFDLGITYAF